jgi:prepilin-type N-terminal cleavage/methylation domain-containing protein/prepilin-type processing-associated H-X9-DG protein
LLSLCPIGLNENACFPFEKGALNMSDRYKAFTLIELLVVISIIALLISILLPALKSARESARAAACLSNQKQLSISVAIYQTNHHAFMPISMWQGDWDASTNPSATPSYATFAQGEDIGWKIQLSDANGKRLTSNTEMNQTLAHGMYRCPSTLVRFDNDVNEAYSNVEKLEGGYGWNNTYMGWWYVNPSTNSVAYGRWPMRQDLMTRPSDSILLGDTLEDSFNGTKFPTINAGQRSYCTIPVPSKKPSYISRRHMDNANFTFADGHSSRIPWEENILGRDGDLDYYYRYEK